MENTRRVFGIGLSRTATSSLAEALNLLGIMTVHFPSDMQTLAELKQGNFRLSVLDKFQGAVDISVAPYYAQLDQIYPGSKFILTVRDIDSWIQSIKTHWRYGERWTGPDYPFIEFIRAAVYGCVAFNEPRFRFVYETHDSNVRAYFANRLNDLLVMNICNGDGWQKLCSFLGVSTPDVPFPRLNDYSGNLKWTKALEAAVEEIRTALPENEHFVIVGNGKLGIQLPGILPLENRNGLDWGAASDDNVAIKEVDQLRRKGIRYVVFLFPFFWWFDYYPEFLSYLKAHSHCIVKNEQLTVLELHQEL